MKIIFNRLFFVFLIVVTISAGTAIAGSSTGQSSESAGDAVSETEAKNKRREELAEFLKKQDNTFVRPTLDNLVKLYWTLGMYNMDDFKAVENYLIINECKLYQKYAFNEVEWREIVLAAKTYIEENMIHFSRNIEIDKVIELDEYSIDERVFPIKKNFEVDIQGDLEVKYNRDTGAVCGDKYFDRDFPRNIILSLNRPLEFDAVPVDPDLATYYLAEQTQRFAKKVESSGNVNAYKRTAVLVLKFRLIQYKNTKNVANGNLRAVFFAMPVAIEVYADEERQLPLYIANLADKRSVKTYHDSVEEGKE